MSYRDIYGRLLIGPSPKPNLSNYEICHQFQDLLEISRGDSYILGKEYFGDYTFDNEFVFNVIHPQSNATTLNQLKDDGFQILSAGRNWYHKSETWRTLFFLWKDNGKSVKNSGYPERKEWCGYPNFSHGGCGFSIFNNPQVRAKIVCHQFGLLRFTRRLNSLETKHLENMHFRKIAEGTMAEYWVNGQDPNTFSIAKEKEMVLRFGFKPTKYDGFHIKIPDSYYFNEISQVKNANR